MSAVQIVPSVLRKQVEEGWKLKPLAEHYNLPVAQMKKALKALDLTIRKFHAPKFEFVEENTEESVTDINVETQNTVEEEVTESDVQGSILEAELKTQENEQVAQKVPVDW